MKYITLILFLLVNFHTVIAQCTNNSLDLGADTTICIGQPYLINAGSGFLSYSWSTGASSSYISVTSPGQYICTVGMSGTNNLVANGDFSSGNTGFTSAYVYGTGGSWGLLSNPGQFAVSTNANLTHNNFPSCTDHTSGAGNFMIMNGSSIANTDVWCQTITVTPSTQYEFSAWFTSVVGGSPAQLNFSVGGGTLGSIFTLNSTVCNWTRYAQTWTSGATQTSASICITSQSTAGGGNDFAIDDIQFSTLCTSTDTIHISVDTLPIVSLGPDTVICSGATFYLDATDNSQFGYLWSDGTNSALNTITATDSNLMVSVTNGACEVTDDLIVTFSSQPNISLGNDTVLCPGDVLSKDVSWPNASYLWSDNSTTNNLSITQPGVYWVDVTDNCGTFSDTVIVSYVLFPLVDLGPDTSLCDGQLYDLNAGYPSASYIWNTGTIDSMITVSQSGTYHVSVQAGSCIDRDTVQVTFDPIPLVELGPDTTICVGQSYLLQANNLNATYLWNDNATGALKSATITGLYWVEVTINNCVISDTVFITVLDYPVASLGNDTVLCGAESIVFDVTQIGVDYLWNDNSVNPSLSVNQSNQVWVEVANFCGVVSDTVNVYVNPYPLVDIGNDTIICDGESFTKDVFSTGANYLWSDGSSISSYEFSSSGVYGVTVTAKGCSTSGTLDLTVQPMPEVELGEDTLICNNTSFLLSIPNDYDSVLWGDGSTNIEYVVSLVGRQWVRVVTGQCTASDTMWVSIENCDTYVEMPNIITPNGDGMNDVFIPVYSVGIVSIKTVIFNRWGKEIFVSVDPQVNWNGQNKKGNDVPNGVYYWISEIQGVDGEPYQIKGAVTVAK